MSYFERFPLFRFALLFVAGILLRSNYSFPADHFFYPLICLLIVLLFLSKKIWLNGVSNGLLLLSILVWGSFWYEIQLPDLKSEPSGIVCISSWVKKSEKSSSFKAIDKITGTHFFIVVRDTSSAFEYGDILKISKSPNPISPPKTISAFDFQTFWKQKGITQQYFLKHGDYRIVEKDRTWMVKVMEWRKVMEVRVEEGFPEKRNIGVAKALTLGIRDHIDENTLEAMRRSGMVHILAISGLHIGIVLLVLKWLISLVRIRVFRLYLGYPMVILVLLFYLLISGLSPSATRATLMSVTFLMGWSMNNKVNSINVLGVAALLMLLQDTRSLFDLGFQLSFLACAGIFFFYPLVSKNLTNLGWIWRKVLDIVLISVSAQILIFPLLVLSFRQYAILSVFSGLLLAPLSIPLVLSGFLYLISVTFELSLISKMLGVLFNFLIEVLQQSAEWVSSIPFSYVHIDLTLPDILFYIMLVITIVLVLIHSKYVKHLWLASFFLLFIRIMKNEPDRVIVQLDQQKRIQILSEPAGLLYEFGKEKSVRLVKNVELESFNWLEFSNVDSIKPYLVPRKFDFVLLTDKNQVLSTDNSGKLVIHNLEKTYFTQTKNGNSIKKN